MDKDRKALQKNLTDCENTIGLLQKERADKLQKIEVVESKNLNLAGERRRLQIEKEDFLAEGKDISIVQAKLKDLSKDNLNNDTLAGLRRKISKLDTKLESLDSERREIEKGILDIDDVEALGEVETELNILIPLLKKFRVISARNEMDSYHKIAGRITEISLI